VTWTRKIVVVWADDLNAAPLAIGADTTAFANISSPPGKEAGRFVNMAKTVTFTQLTTITRTSHPNSIVVPKGIEWRLFM